MGAARGRESVGCVLSVPIALILIHQHDLKTPMGNLDYAGGFRLDLSYIECIGGISMGLVSGINPGNFNGGIVYKSVKSE